jgi:OLD-like protein
MLEGLQAEALAGVPSTVVLVEGLSDYFAVTTIAGRRGRRLQEEGIAIVPMGGATNIGRFLAIFGPGGRDVGIAGLCDAAEARYVARALRAAGVDDALGSARSLFVCDRDLEDELIRALGATAVEHVIDRAGDLANLRRLQQMPAHRDRPREQHLHRFMGARSARKYRYAQLLAEALPDDDIPRPLRDLVDSV